MTQPTRGFYELIVTFETIIRKEVNVDSLASHSMEKCKLRELVLSDLAVQQQWNHLTDNVCDQSLLETFVGKFLCVRGHSVAKVATEQKQKSRRDNEKKSSSLRKKLRQKSSTSFVKYHATFSVHKFVELVILYI